MYVFMYVYVFTYTSYSNIYTFCIFLTLCTYMF